MTSLVLSLFPGIGLLDIAFEEAGFCVVRGPDVIWGGDIHKFAPPAGRFDGVIGGPPCQQFSSLGIAAKGAGQTVAANLIPEFERVVSLAAPAWFLMENVAAAPLPSVTGYAVDDHVLDNRLDCGGEQRRRRRFSFGSNEGRRLAFDFWRPATPATCLPTVTASGSSWDAEKGRSRGDKTVTVLRRSLIAQGLPDDYLARSPFTVEGAIRAVGNGVPLPMGRAVAQAVRRACA